MKTAKRTWAVKAAGAGALALILATPSFAQSRDDQRRGNDNRRSETSQRNDGYSQTYRDNQRVTVQGKVSSFSRERDGYRVQLDRGRESYWVPQSYFRNRGHNLQVGISIGLGGIFRGGSVYVDAVNWPDEGRYRDGYDNGAVRGIVERVDVRRGVADIRDNRSGRVIRVDFRERNRRDRLSVDDLRRGDYVELSGAWAGGGVFDAYRIDSVRDARR